MCHASLFTSSAFPKAELFFACMVVIILSILYISIPLIIQSHQEYIKTQQVLTEITSLRAPSNKLMSSQPKELDKNKKNCRHLGRWWMLKLMKPSSHYKTTPLM